LSHQQEGENVLSQFSALMHCNGGRVESLHAVVASGAANARATPQDSQKIFQQPLLWISQGRVLVSNVVTLHTDKRWKAVIQYEHQNGPIKIEHYFEEISELHLIIEHGPDWNTLTRCTVTLNRPDDGAEQNSEEKSLKEERT
jgi:hypothetical protein